MLPWAVSGTAYLVCEKTYAVRRKVYVVRGEKRMSLIAALGYMQ